PRPRRRPRRPPLPRRPPPRPRRPRRPPPRPRPRPLLPDPLPLGPVGSRGRRQGGTPMHAFARRSSFVGLVGALLAAVLALSPGAPAGAALPCEVSWADPGTSGLWDQPGVDDESEAQWSPAHVPTAADAVCLPAGDYTVTISAGDGPPVAESLSIGAGVTVIVAPPGAPTDDDDLIATVSGSIETAG